MDEKFRMNLKRLVLGFFSAIFLILFFFVAKWSYEAISESISIEDRQLDPSMIQTPEGDILDVPDIGSNQVKPEYPKRVVIGLRSWSDLEIAKKIIVDSGGRVLNVLNWPEERIIAAEIPNQESGEKILKNSFWGKLIGGIGLSSFGNRINGGIDYLESDPEASPLEEEVPGQLTDWGVLKINADKLWGTVRGRGVKVGILDTGFDKNHPDIKNNIKGGVNFTSDIATGVVDSQKWDDDHSHGTKMAGIVAAEDNEIGIVGVAPEAELYAIKVLGGSRSDGPTSGIVSGIYWAADNGMNVINMSLSVGSNSGLDEYWKDQFRRALDYAKSKGVVSVGAAGNYGRTTGLVAWPNAYDEGVITVSAITKNNEIINFSSHGPAVELTAPGVQIVTTSISFASDSFEVPGSGLYSIVDGTSAAAPFVTGAVALLLEKNPNLTPAQVGEILDETAVDIGDSGRDEYFGFGIVNPYDSILDPPPVEISMIYPIGGETWFLGSDQEIIWSSETFGENMNKVDIKLVHTKNNEVKEIVLALGADNTGKKIISVPDNLSPSGSEDQYYISISCNKVYFGKCNPGESGLVYILEIPEQKLNIKYPTGGERLPSGTKQNISWGANFWGGPAVNIDLLEQKQVPQYYLISQKGDWDKNVVRWLNASNSYWSYVVSQNYNINWNIGKSVLEIPDTDTCDGNIGKDINNGIFVCPAISTSGTFSCLDVAESKEQPRTFWKRNITCEYSTEDIGSSAPTYSYIGGSEVRNCYNAGGYCLPSEWDSAGFLSVNYTPGPTYGYQYYASYPVLSVPPDTCNGNSEMRANGGVFSCPSSHSSSKLRCVDISKASNFSSSGIYWQSFLMCSYNQSGSKYVAPAVKEVPVGRLAENILNVGFAVVDIPRDLLGDYFKVKISCDRFLGVCHEGVSDSFFSIVEIANPRTLTVEKVGLGSVTDGNIICAANEGDCEKIYESGKIISLTAIPIDSSVTFTGWEGACTGLGICQIGMTEDRLVRAVFSAKSVTISAVAEPGSIFTGWTGNCLLTGDCFVTWSSSCQSDIPCNITINKNEEIKAEFIKNANLAVNISGTGTGTVIGTNKNIYCTSGTCMQTYSNLGELETLRAYPGPGSTFVGWFGGSCSGTNNFCFFQMNQNRTVTAVFNLPCTADTWICGDWSSAACPNGSQSRTCELVNCPGGVDVPSPATSQACGPDFKPGDIREVRPN